MPSEYYKKFDLGSIKFNEQTETKRGSPVVYLKVKDGDSPRIQLNLPESPLTAPFGIHLSKFATEGSRKSLNISLTPELVKFWRAFDEMIIQWAIANRRALFKLKKSTGKPPSEDNIREMYHPVVQQDEAGKYPPRLSTKVNSMKGKRQIRVFHKKDDKLHRGSPDDVGQYSKIMAIVEAQCVWFQTGTRFGVTLLTTDCMLYPDESRKEATEEFNWGSSKVPTTVEEGKEKKGEQGPSSSSNSMLFSDPSDEVVLLGEEKAA